MPWGQIMRTPAVLVLFVNHWVMGWASSTVMQWAPTWMTEELDFDIKNSGFLSALPPLVGFAVATISGAVASYLIQGDQVTVSTVRKFSQFMATTGAAVPLLLMVRRQTIPELRALGIADLSDCARLSS
jgi:sugar phosphate permease